MKILSGFASSLFLFFNLASGSFAQSLDTGVAVVQSSVEEVITAKLTESRPGISLGEIKPSPIKGLYRVPILGGPVLYVTADGAHFVAGDLFAVVSGGFINLAEQERETERAALLGTVNVKDQIVFAPKGQPVKAAITVYTDVDCYYCQKLHQEVPALNRLGIEVRYMAFPRAGVGSDSYKKIASAWCAGDQQGALTKLKNRQPVAQNVCANNPVTAQYKMGQQMGVTGTPAMVTKEGRLIPGYMPALKLAQTLGVEIDPKLASELAPPAK